MQVGFKIYNDVDNGDDDYDDKGDSCKSYSSSVYVKSQNLILLIFSIGMSALFLTKLWLTTKSILFYCHCHYFQACCWRRRL